MSFFEEVRKDWKKPFRPLKRRIKKFVRLIKPRIEDFVFYFGFDYEVYRNTTPHKQEGFIKAWVMHWFAKNNRFRLYTASQCAFLLVDREKLFSCEYYRNAAKLQTRSKKRLVKHYITNGWKKGLNPSAVFDQEYYLVQNPTVDICPLIDYVCNGQYDGWKVNDRVKDDAELMLKYDLLDDEYYKENYYSDLEGLDHTRIIYHFLARGVFEEVLPVCKTTFDLMEYCKHVPEAMNDGCHPIVYLARQVDYHSILPPSLIQEYCMSSYEGMEYISRIMRAAQDKALLEEYDLQGKRLIAYLTPSTYSLNGGVMSIAGFAHNTKALFDVHNAQTIMMTTPDTKRTFFQYHNFKCLVNVFRMEQLQCFKNLEWLCIHIPEYLVPLFVPNLSDNEIGFFKRIPHLQINILNQNIQQMPPPEEIERLRELTCFITQTTAHWKYTTKELAEKYQTPVSYMLATKGAGDEWTDYDNKEDILIYSPDEHPCKKDIIDLLHREFPDLKLVEIRNMHNTVFCDYARRAKWSITFGEGADGYFVEPAWRGGVSFTVLNPDFCDEAYKGIPTVFASYEEMKERLADTMRSLDEIEAYTLTNQLIWDKLSLSKTEKIYWDCLHRYYTGQYTYRPSK